MSKVYSLIFTDGNPYDGVVQKVLCVSTNHEQLKYIHKRISKIIKNSESNVELKELFSYKPKNTKSIQFLLGINSDISFCTTSLLDHFFKNEKGVEISDKKMISLNKSEDYLSYSAEEHCIKDSLNHEDIDKILKEVCICYRDIERENKMMENGSYWQVDKIVV